MSVSYGISNTPQLKYLPLKERNWGIRLLMNGDYVRALTESTNRKI